MQMSTGSCRILLTRLLDFLPLSLMPHLDDQFFYAKKEKYPTAAFS